MKTWKQEKHSSCRIMEICVCMFKVYFKGQSKYSHWSGSAWNFEGEAHVAMETPGCWRWQEYGASAKESYGADISHIYPIAQQRGCQNMTEKAMRWIFPNLLELTGSWRWCCRSWYLPCWVSTLLWPNLSFLGFSSSLLGMANVTHVFLFYRGSRLKFLYKYQFSI